MSQSSPSVTPAIAAVLLSLASCVAARTYGGPARPESEIARAYVVQPLLLIEAHDRMGRITSVDGEIVEHEFELLAALTFQAGSTAVELMPGEHHVELWLENGSVSERRTLRWHAEPGRTYRLEWRPSERQPPVEAFVSREDTREELGVSCIAPPEVARFGLDAADWRTSTWRVEDDWHWISFEPVTPTGDDTRERVRLEWSESERWNPPPEAAWALGVDLRREFEREYAEFAWREVEVGDATSVHEWSGLREGRAKPRHGLVVVRLCEGRVSVARYTTDSEARFAAERARWREFGAGDGWTAAWTEARP